MRLVLRLERDDGTVLQQHTSGKIRESQQIDWVANGWPVCCEKGSGWLHGWSLAWHFRQSPPPQMLDYESL